MASPFSIFRRHQKVLLAVLGILCMFSFIFIPIFMDSLSSGAAQIDTVVSTKDGPVNGAQLESMVRTRAIVNRFLFEAMSYAAGRPMQREDILGPTTPEAVVETWILSKKAEAVGIKISDEAITEFLRQRTADRVTTDEFNKIMNNLQIRGARQLYDMLRPELMALQLQQLVRATELMGLPSVPPAVRWEYYTRLNRRANVECLPVPVENFMAQVSDVTDKDLREFYEKHKATYPDSDSPAPGFHRPKKARFEYLVAAHDDFFEPAAVPEQEIKDYYEKNKDSQFAVRPPAGALMPAEPRQPSQPPAAKVAEPKIEGDQPRAAEEASDTNALPADAVPPGNGGADGEQPPVAAPSEKNPEQEPQSSGAPKQPSAEATPPSDAAAETATPPPSEPVSNTIPDELILPRDIRALAPGAHEPLWKVEERIRNQLAGQRAFEKIDSMLKELTIELATYGRALSTWEVHGSKGKPPARPDFGALAATHHLKAGDTGLISANEAIETTDLGKSFISGAEPFVASAYEQLADYRPIMSMDRDGNGYLSWKVEATEDHIPAFAKIRAEVLQAWKRVEARKLAEAEARRLASQAASEPNRGKSLREVFASEAGKKIFETGFFSWLSFGDVPMFSPRVPPQLSQVPGVERVGNEFMEVVFGLEPQNVDTARNQPQTIFYVVRMVAVEPSIAVLREMFMADSYQRYASVAAVEEQQQYRAWIKEIEDEAELRWVPQPAPVRR